MQMTAVDAARTIQAIDAEAWLRLELAAFREHDPMLYRLDPRATRRTRGLRERLVPLMTLAAVVALFAPAVGMALLVPSRISAAAPTQTGSVLPASTLCFLAFDVIVSVLLIESVRDRAGSRFLRGVGAFGVVMAGIALVLLAAADLDGVGLPAWQWSVPIVGALVLGLALVVASTVLGGGSGDRGAPPRTGAPEEEWRRFVVGRIDAGSRDRVRAELAEAIDELERRGLVDAAVAVRARSTELGLLSLRMEQDA